MKVADYTELKYGSEWYDHVGMADAARVHARNVKACEQAWAEGQKKSGPIRVLALHGSGRNVKRSCALEESNSKLFLRTGLSALHDDKGVEIEEVELRQHSIEACNNCVSTTSTWCRFPCDCFPLDDMQKLYPKVLRSHVLLMSTGVAMGMISSRLKAFIDRLISLDGGIFQPKLLPKTEEEKRKAMKAAAEGRFAYTPRIAGKVCAYFFSSKDESNPIGKLPEEIAGPENTYSQLMSKSLFWAWHDYGCVHATPWYATITSKHDEDYQFDKRNMSAQPDAHAEAKKVVRAAVAKARDLREKGFEPQMDRINRT